MKLLWILFLLSVKSYGAFFESFGPSALSQATSGQMIFPYSSASNNYDNPSALAFSPQSEVVLGGSMVDLNLHDARQIIVKNEATHDRNQTGDILLDESADYLYFLHATLVLSQKNQTVLGLSLAGPTNSIMTVDSGPTLLPHYPLYQGRYERPEFYINVAQALSDTWSLSLGLFTGQEFEASTYFVGGTDTGPETQGQIKASGNWQFRALFSLSRKWSPQSLSFFTYRQKMSSSFKGEIQGEVTTPFNFFHHLTMQSLSYFQPETYKIGHLHRFSSWDSLGISTTLEWQCWSDYRSPTLRFT